MPGCPTTWVDAGSSSEDGTVPDVTAILGAIRAGRTFVSASPAGPQLYLDRADGGLATTVVDGVGAALHLVGDRGVVAAAAVDSPTWSVAFAVPTDVRYVRAQLLGANGEMRALTSPIWFD
jgi:hypothetical protein